MLNKTVVCIYTEGETEKVFYNKLLDFIKSKSPNKRFIVDEIKKSNIAGIGNFKTKILNKFRKEVVSKYINYKKIVVMCYDEDVFDLVNQTPPIDRSELEKDLRAYGADEVIHLIAKKSIEDLFLLDLDGILRSLRLSKDKIKNIKGANGVEKINNLYSKVNKIYFKGSSVEPFVEQLDIEKICKTKCDIYCKLCSILLGYKGCK